MKKTISTITAIMIVSLSSSLAMAKNTEPKIANDQANLPTDLTINIANIAISNGVKEPLTIAKDNQHAKIAGTSATTCLIKLSAENQILGVSCK